MAKVKKQHPNLLLLLVVLIESVILFCVLFSQHGSQPPTQLEVVTSDSERDVLQTKIANQLPMWLPSSLWSNAMQTTQVTSYGDLIGSEITTTITTPQATLAPFEDEAFLKSLGFLPDTNLSADGPGSSNWGYTKEEGNKRQYLIFSYKVTPSNTNPNQPIQFTCPCQTKVNVFISKAE